MTKLQQAKKLERKRYDICVPGKMIYMNIGYKLDRAKPTNDEKILKMRRLL